MYDFAVIGGGIVGLSTAMALSAQHSRAKLIVLEKEPTCATHQTGHNSGVIHSGIYYKPGSLKAQLCRDGNRSIIDFCRKHDIAHEICGKLIVATEPKELPLLEDLYQRGLQNGVAASRMYPEEVAEIEPHVRCLKAIRVPTAGIVDYREVCRKMVDEVLEHDGHCQWGVKVDNIISQGRYHVVQTTHGDIEARFVINCAGLHSDRVARLAQATTSAQIVPFRGEYYELVPERRHLVRGLIYPVPNPNFPFLGVHFTRMIDGSVHAGPNAILSLKREGYRKQDVSLRDCWETFTYPGFWRLAKKHSVEGLQEVIRSFSKRAFVRTLQRLIPEITAADVMPTHAGVRAQALLPDGRMVDDFLLVEGPNAIHVCNSPSPAATASIEIGKALARKVPQERFQVIAGTA